MNVFKELISLVKMLFSSHPQDFNDVSLESMKHFPFRGFIMMWCGRIIVREERIDHYRSVFDSFPSWKYHELHHLRQAQQKKFKNSWIRFYANYFREWLKGNPLFNFHNGAYYTIPQEVEAYANEQNPGYEVLSDLSGSKYDLKKRVKTFRNNRGNWKSYIREL